MLAIFIIVFIFMYHKAQLRFEITRQKLKQAQLESEVEIRQQTLYTISRELHDNFGQVLSLIKLNLAHASKSLVSPQREVLQEANDQIATLLNEMRSLSHSMGNEEFEPTPLPLLIEKDLKTIGKQDGLTVHFTSEIEDLPQNDLSSKILLYRMFQELSSNVINHADATHLRVNIKSENGNVHLSVKDNGKGFDNTNQKRGKGFTNLRERCELIGAFLKVNSIEGAGTEVIITLPKKKNHGKQ